MAPAAVELSQPGTPSGGARSRFLDLRGVRWRIDLGVLPSSPSNSIEDLRRVTADSRRRYANLRRRLLIDPHLPKDGNTSLDLSMDNPLSQNPDSNWGRYFRNTELEKIVDWDLSRLYPEHGSHFQTSACQAMLRRILLMWCLRHPEYGYRQGMHELLAPLLYVLHVDVQWLQEVQKANKDYFNYDFEEMLFANSNPTTNCRYTKSGGEWDRTSSSRSEACKAMTGSRDDELDPETRDIFMLSDAYGAEGELGILLSERFMEHDAYCMFDGMMNRDLGGVVAMAEFFSHSSSTGSSSGLPPIIEASSALYHLLANVDPSLYSHLVELGVEPQYFALRWLRVLFGREFSLEALLVVWDEIFRSANGVVAEKGSEYNFKVLCSPRGAFIAGMAVSMLLHLRSSLLATEYATSCLQRLLSFPEDIDMKKLIEKAKSLQAIALETNFSSASSSLLLEGSNNDKPTSSGIVSASKVSLQPVQGSSYWEEKWRVLNRDEALPPKGGRQIHESVRGGGSLMKEGSLRRGLGSVFRTVSDPSASSSSSSKIDKSNINSVRRRLIDDFSQEICSASADASKVQQDLQGDDGDSDSSENKGLLIPTANEASSGDTALQASDCVEDLSCLSADNSSVFSGADPANESERSSVTSNSFVGDNNDEESGRVEEGEPCQSSFNESMQEETEGVEAPPGNAAAIGAGGNDLVRQAVALNERKPLAGKFQWFWKLGKGSSEGSSQLKGGEAKEASTTSRDNSSACLTSDRGCNPVASQFVKADPADKKMLNTIRNLGQSMLENIQVIESVFQQDRGALGNLSTTTTTTTTNILGSKGQHAAMAALKELRKISNLLSEM